MAFDDDLSNAIDSLRDIIHVLPRSIGEIFAPFLTAFHVFSPATAISGVPASGKRVQSQSPLFGVQFNFGEMKSASEALSGVFKSIDLSRFRFPKTAAGALSPLKVDTSSLQSGFNELDRQSIFLTRDFVRLGEEIRKIRFPRFGAVASFGNAANFAKTVRNFVSPMVRPIVGTVLNLAPIRAGLGRMFQDVLSNLPPLSSPMKQLPYKPGVTIQIPRHVYGPDFRTPFVAMASNFFASARGVFGVIPGLFAAAMGKASSAASGIASGAGGIGGRILGGLGSVARFGAIPGAFLAMTGEVENLRAQALAANAHNVRFADYSGAIFAEQMRFNYGNYFRTRSIALATQGSAVELARNANAMEQAFLPHDIMKTDLGNKIGSVKAGIAKGFADTLLTPIANFYNSPIWDHIRQGMKSSPVVGVLGSLGTVGAGALAGFAVGGPVGAVVGGALAATGLGAFLDPMKGGSVLGGALAGGLALGAIFAVAGSFIPGVGTVLGGAVGFGLGAIGGGLKAAFTPDEATKVNDGPWMEFIRQANGARPLRPPMRIPPHRYAPTR
jgi:hypothetical protein